MNEMEMKARLIVDDVCRIKVTNIELILYFNGVIIMTTIPI